MLTYGSVCSGIEAATVAWHRLGWRAAFYSEIEPFPSSLLRHYYPEVPNLGDLNGFRTWPEEKIDVLVGGTPCQSFSVAGLRKGLADPRGNLCLTFLALADRLKPRWLVWENVPGVLSSGGGRDFGSFLGALGQLGYGFAYRVLDAQYFGVPQRRRRVFVVGCLGDWRSAAAVLFESASLRGDSAPRRQPRERVAPTISARAKGGGGLGTDFDRDGGLGTDFDRDGGLIHRVYQDSEYGVGEYDSAGSLRAGRIPEHQMVLHAPEIARCVATREGTSQDWETTTMVAHSLRADGFDASEDHGADAGELAPTLRAMGHTGSHPNAGGQVAVAMNLRGREGGAMPELDDVASLRAASGGSSRSYVAAMQVRRLTPRECERLQGFPDDYTLVEYRKKPAADGPRYKALGNSMAVPVMRWIGERILLQEMLA